MERQQINRLLEKYFEGKTSLAEEKTLRKYFTKTTKLPPELEEYRVLFAYFEAEKETKYEGEIYLPKQRNYKKLISFSAIAAVIAVLLFVKPFKSQQTHQNKEIPVQATENAKSLFMIMGSFPEESKENLEYLNELNALKIQGAKKEKDSLQTEKSVEK